MKLVGRKTPIKADVRRPLSSLAHGEFELMLRRSSTQSATRRRVIIGLVIPFALAGITATVSCVRHTVHPVRLEGTSPDVNLPDGVYYSLPKTLVRVTVQVQQTHYEPGKHYGCREAAEIDVPVQFTTNGAKEYLSTDKFKLGKIEVTELAIPDPDNVFLIEIQDLWTETREHLVTLNEAGLIVSGKSVGHDRTLEYVVKTIEAATKIAGARFAPRTDGGPAMAPGPGTARSCAIAIGYGEEIKGVREARLKLTSEATLATNPSVLDRQLSDLETQKKELLAAFYTWEVTQQTWTFEVEPKDGKKFRICSFTRDGGIDEGTGFGPNNTGDYEEESTAGDTEILIAFAKWPKKQYSDYVGDQSSNGCKSRRRSFFYRVPALAKAWVYHGNKIVLERDMLVNQFGRVASLPDHAGSVQSQLKVEYHNDNGSPKSVEWTTTAPDPANIETIGNAVSEAVAARAAQKASEPSAIDELNEQLGAIEKIMGIVGGSTGNDGGDGDDGGDGG